MKKLLLVLVKMLISTVLMLVLIRRVDIDHLRVELSSLPIWWLGVGGSVMMLQSLSSGARWQWLLRQSGLHDIGFSWCVRGSMIGSFFNQCLPSSIGGDAVRVVMARQKGLSWRKASASVLAERASGLFCLIFLAFGMGALACLVPDYQHQSLILWAICSVLLAGILGVIGVAFAVQRGFYPKYLAPFFTMPVVAETIALICTIYQNRHAILLLTILGIINSGLNVLVIWLYADVMDVRIMPILMVMPVLLAMLATLVPISLAGWGLREGAMIGLFLLYDVPKASTLVLSVAFGLSTLIAALPGAILWLWPHKKAPDPSTTTPPVVTSS